LPLINICDELFREIEKIKAEELKKIKDLTGIPEGLIFPQFCKNISYDYCSKVFYERVKDCLCKQ